MEPIERISEEWGSLRGLYTAEEADFMTKWLGGNYSVTEEHCGNTSFCIPSAFWPGHDSTIVSVTGINNNSYFPSNVANTNFFCFSQGSSFSADIGNVFPTISSGTYSCDLATNFHSMSMWFCMGNAKFSPHSFQWNDNLSQQISENEESGLDPGKLVLADDNLLANRECEMIVSEHAEEDRSINQRNPAKRVRSSIEDSRPRKNAKSKKNPKSASMSNNEEDRSTGLQLQSSCSCFSEADSNASLELNGGASLSLNPKDPATLNLNGKSILPLIHIAFMQGRERINGRLRILQNLVPNGTKVDISTMLEEAVQYVKFLQLQIKILSSDDLWMYAPITYNGINIGLDLNITPTEGR